MKPTKQQKLKRVQIQIVFRDHTDLGLAMVKIKNSIQSGIQIDEFTFDTATGSFQFEFLEHSNFIEREIDGIWFRIIKSKI